MPTTYMAQHNQPHGTILIAEDEPEIAKILSDYLRIGGFETLCLEVGPKVVDTVKKEAPDLLLLDHFLPGKSGMDICRELRVFSDVPIIMVSTCVEEIDRLLGLELGADDYICKPFSPREVVARVKAVLRRGGHYRAEPRCNSPFKLDEVRRRITVNNRSLSLTPNEYNLLKILLAQPGRVFSRDQLLDGLYPVWRDVADRTIDSHIKNLRKKISRELPGREVIVSVYGVGYKLELENDSP